MQQDSHDFKSYDSNTSESHENTPKKPSYYGKNNLIGGLMRISGVRMCYTRKNLFTGPLRCLKKNEKL